MKRFGCMALVTLGLTILCAPALAEDATGIVYNDSNQNGCRDGGEKGLRGVLVSNGADVTATDRTGRYTLPVTDDTIVFVIKPSGWMTPVGPDSTAPRFYYIHKPAGSPPMKYAAVAPTGPLPASIDFPLYRRHEPKRFQVVCLGDTQTRDVEEVQFLKHDILEDLIGTEAAFGVTLGDNVFNDLSVFPQIIPAMSSLGIPWCYVPGNHDHNHDAPTSLSTDDTFEKYFGPSYYAYDYASVHFIVLNDIRHDVGKDEYHGGLGDRQLAFIKNDLGHVSHKKLVVLMMHIPIMELEDRDELYALLKAFPHTFSLSAHTHSQRHVFVGKSQGWLQDTPHHHLIHGTACGSWWGGEFDERGIPITPMSDGVPNGYSIISFNKTSYTVDYRVAHEPADYQMNIALPEQVATADVQETEAVVNIFAGSRRSSVEMQVDGKGRWFPMTNFSGKDANYVELLKRQGALAAKLAELKGTKPDDKAFQKQTREELAPVMRFLPEPHDTDHLWKACLPEALPPGQHVLTVRTKDIFGKVYQAKRMFTVTP